MTGSSGSSAHGAGPVVDRSCETAIRKRSNSSLNFVGSIDSVRLANASSCSTRSSAPRMSAVAALGYAVK